MTELLCLFINVIIKEKIGWDSNSFNRVLSFKTTFTIIFLIDF